MGKEYKYYLPDTNKNKIEYTTENHSLIVVGANGSGKSRLGAWMEKVNPDNVHRIVAQRKLSFSEYIPLKSHELSEKMLFYGNANPRVSSIFDRKHSRWNTESEKAINILLDDFDNALSTLYAKYTRQTESFFHYYSKVDKKDRENTEPPITVIEQLIKIWNAVFPHRQLKLKDAKVTAIINQIEYNGNDMSDGERVALYLIAQCLSLPQNITIIIDEPELHLHRSIMNRLWKEIENERKDCFFIYITHDTQFASEHINSDKLWLKEYNGTSWKYEKIENSELPEQLLLEILGNRKNVLFVEGETGSYDSKLYAEIYQNYYVVSCGSCREVIQKTKAFKECKYLHNLKIKGVIDRDYRSEYELDKLKEDDIYVVDVAEVENLFIVEEILEIVNERLAHQDTSKVEDAKKFVIDTKFSNQIHQQVLNSVVAEAKYKLETLDISAPNESDIEERLKNILTIIKFETIKEEKKEEYNKLLNERNYKEILKKFNQKQLAKEIGKSIGIPNNDYCDFVLRLLRTEDYGIKIKSALKAYLPKELDE